MSKKHTFSLAVSAACYLPTVLTACALRVPSYTVEDHREHTGGWLIHIVDLPQVQTTMLLDAVPTHMAYIYEPNKVPA